MSTHQPFTLDRVVRLIIAALIIAGVVWLINILKDVLLPFFVACLIAYILEPFVQFNRRLLHLKSRIPAIFVTLFEACFFAAVLCYFLIPMMIDEMHQMGAAMRQYATAANMKVIPEQWHQFIRAHIDFNYLSQMLTTHDWSKAIEDLLVTTWNIISGSFSILVGVIGWFIVVLYVIFIMIDYDRLSAGFKQMVPPKYRDTVFRIFGDVKDSMNHYFRGQALIAAIVGVPFAIGFLIIGLPMAIVFGLFIGVLNLVPYLQLISLIPATLLCLIYSAGGEGDFWTIFGATITVYCIVQCIQDLYLTPKIMGKAMGLNPAIILLSLSVWGTLLGLIGLIIALPLTTLLISYYNQYISSVTPDDDSSSPVATSDDAPPAETE